MSHLAALLGLATLSLSSSANAALSLATEYSGSNFFDAWTFYSGVDTNTTGNVLFQPREAALTSQLAFVNSAGHAIIKVDNTTNGASDPTFGRASIKMSSNATVPQGSLVVMDAVHVPFGCSVWPAFWMQGPNWPAGGEIDVFEGVNQELNNRFTLHTADGCQHPDNASSTSIETGTLLSTDCFNATNGNQGCSVEDPSTTSYGADFAQNGGGVYAMLWNDDGIKTWFFNRSSIPSDINGSAPNPDGWTTPTASWPTSSCDVSKFFGAQTLIFDITLCGNFAGEASVFAQTCSGTCTDLIKDPTNYNNAYFEVSYVRVYSGDSSKKSAAPRAVGISGTWLLSMSVAVLASLLGAFMTSPL
ncbi:concanavalin A-like lectin/glucanase domain-containing protein [Phellopilus nigrolimitatus]|nr:concanavalin A-like lectin/glucanase domain-containing protein [Phellopilus nigrolimitatus]